MRELMAIEKERDFSADRKVLGVLMEEAREGPRGGRSCEVRSELVAPSERVGKVVWCQSCYRSGCYRSGAFPFSRLLRRYGIHFSFCHRPLKLYNTRT